MLISTNKSRPFQELIACSSHFRMLVAQCCYFSLSTQIRAPEKKEDKKTLVRVDTILNLTDEIKAVRDKPQVFTMACMYKGPRLYVVFTTFNFFFCLR